MYYIEIHIKGRTNTDLADWFGELQLQENTRDETILHGKLPDVSAVYGVISRLGCLVIPLASICVEESDIHQRKIAEEEPIHPVN